MEHSVIHTCIHKHIWLGNKNSTNIRQILANTHSLYNINCKKISNIWNLNDKTEIVKIKQNFFNVRIVVLMYSTTGDISPIKNFTYQSDPNDIIIKNNSHVEFLYVFEYRKDYITGILKIMRILIENIWSQRFRQYLHSLDSNIFLKNVKEKSLFIVFNDTYTYIYNFKCYF